MKARLQAFGMIEIDGRRYDHDVVLEQGVVRKRKKGPSKAYRDLFGHTPVSVDEDIPWSGTRLIIGTGASGQLPVMDEVYDTARLHGIDIVAEPTAQACQLLNESGEETVAAILHVTC